MYFAFIAIGESAFAGCDNLQDIRFPDSLISIERKAFDNCPNYELVVLPASIQEVGFHAFYSVWHVWFKGTESQWNSLYSDGTDSSALNRKPVHFNCTGNEFKTEVIAATCTVNGYTQYSCTVCKEIRQTDPTEAPGHSYGAWYVAKEATHASKGLERRDCNNCDHYKSKDIPIQPHTDKSKICTLCGEKEQQPEASTPATTPSWESIGTLPTPQSGAASSDEEVKTNPIVIVLIVAAAVTVIGGTTLVLIKKKK